MDLHTGGRLIHVGKFVLGLDLHTQGYTYSWREVCVRFRMDLHTRALIYLGKFVSGLGWAYTQGSHIYGSSLY